MTQIELDIPEPEPIIAKSTNQSSPSAENSKPLLLPKEVKEYLENGDGANIDGLIDRLQSEHQMQTERDADDLDDSLSTVELDRCITELHPRKEGETFSICSSLGSYNLFPKVKGP